MPALCRSAGRGFQRIHKITDVLVGQIGVHPLLPCVSWVSDLNWPPWRESPRSRSPLRLCRGYLKCPGTRFPLFQGGTAAGFIEAEYWHAGRRFEDHSMVSGWCGRLQRELPSMRRNGNRGQFIQNPPDRVEIMHTPVAQLRGTSLPPPELYGAMSPESCAGGDPATGPNPIPGGLVSSMPDPVGVHVGDMVRPGHGACRWFPPHQPRRFP